MFVRMLTGCVEEVFEEFGKRLIYEGRAVAIEDNKKVILKAEELGGVPATAGIEIAMIEPKQEQGIIARFFRGPRTPR